MKKIILFALLSVSIIKAEAQLTEVGLDLPVVKPQLSIEEESRQLQRTLLLNEGQYVKAKEVNKERRETLDAIHAMFPHEPEKRDKRMLEVEQQFDEEFAAIFTKKQLKEYLELNGRSEIAEVKPESPEGPSFNDQIQSVIQKAVTPALDSTQVASKENSGTDSLSILSAGAIKDSTSLKLFNTPLQDEIALEQNSDSSRSKNDLKKSVVTDSLQISLIHQATDLGNKPKPITKEIITFTNDGAIWEEGDQRDSNKLKNDSEKDGLKAGPPEGEMNIDKSDQKEKELNEVNPESTENDNMNIEIPDRDAGFKDSRDSMEPIK